MARPGETPLGFFIAKVDPDLLRRRQEAAERQRGWRLVAERIAMFDVELECSHGHLPCDPRPACTCWQDIDVTQGEAIRADLEAGFKRMEESNEHVVSALRELSETLDALGQDQAALAQVVMAQRPGRKAARRTPKRYPATDNINAPAATRTAPGPVGPEQEAQLDGG